MKILFKFTNRSIKVEHNANITDLENSFKQSKIELKNLMK